MASDDYQRVGDLVTLIRGTTYKGALVGKPGPALLGLGSIVPGGGFRAGDFKTYGGDCPEKLILRPGDLYVSLKGATKDGEMIGSIARVPPQVPLGRLTQDTVKLEIQPEAEELRSYLYWLLRTPQYRTYCAGRATGSAVVALSREDFLAYPVPRFTAFRASIVSLLEGVDDKIELNRKMNETLEAMAQAIFRDWFVDFGPTRRKIEGATDPVEIMGGLVTDAERAQKLADLFPAGFGDNGILPEGWRTGELGDLVSNVVERCKPSEETRALPYVPIDTIDAHKLVLGQWRPGEEAQSSLVRFKSNDILFGAMRPYFHKVAVSAFDGVTRTTVFVLRPKLQADLYFAASQINEPSSIEYATLHSSGSTIPYAVWQNSFEKLPVALPPPGVRRKYGEVVAQYFSLMNLNEGQSRTLAATRDLLLPKLMSGEICLREAEEQLEAAQ